MEYADGKVKDLQIAYIGGGSRGWAWTFMTDLAMDEELSGTIRLYDIDTEDTKKTTHYAEVYSPTKIETFKCVDDGSCGATGKGKARQFASYEFVKEEPHIFGRIPIITVYNNEEQMSDLEKIETLVNDYDKKRIWQRGA